MDTVKMNLFIGSIRGEIFVIPLIGKRQTVPALSDNERRPCVDHIEKVIIESSRGQLHIKPEKTTKQQIMALMALPENERFPCAEAIRRYIETTSRTKPMRPFEAIAKAFKIEFKKIDRIKFDGEPLKSAGHLRMPVSTDELKVNPLFLDDLSVFLPFSIKSREDQQRYDELKANHPHTQNEESLFRKMDSPVVAFDLFVKCCESGVYPPVDLLHWVADGMKRFLVSDGKDDLNTIFGFDKKGKGRNLRNAFDNVRETKSDALELMKMAALIDYFDLTVKEAAAFMAQVGKYGSKEGCNKNDEELAGGSTYIRKWYGEWNEYMRNHDQFRSIYQKLVLDRSGNVDDTSKLRFLDKFGPYQRKGKPLYSLPENIEKFLKKHGRL